MTPGRIIVIALAAVVVAMAAFLAWQTRTAKEAAKEARNEAESLRVMLEDAESENAQLRAVLARAYAAIDRAGEAVEEAAKSHAERTEAIDSVDPDWLMCPLPDGVRAVFADGAD